jgi:hypothetical protein
MKHLGLDEFNTIEHLASTMILEEYSPSSREWGTVVERYDALESGDIASADLAAPEVDDALTRWLDDVRADDGVGVGTLPEHTHEHGRLGGHGVRLPRCANCGAASAVLQKCSGCGKIRYCNKE